MKTLAQISAALAFLLCLIGGAYILYHCDHDSKEDAMWIGIGLYFMGKAFFVGPMLLVAAERLGPKPPGS